MKKRLTTDEVRETYDEVLRDCPDADKIRAALGKYSLNQENPHTKADHEPPSVSAHQIDDIEPLFGIQDNATWTLQAVAYGDNTEKIIAILHSLGKTTREIERSLRDDPVAIISHMTIARIIVDLHKRYDCYNI